MLLQSPISRSQGCRIFVVACTAAAVPSFAPNIRSQKRRHAYARGKGTRYSVAWITSHPYRRTYSDRASGHAAVRSNVWKICLDELGGGGSGGSVIGNNEYRLPSARLHVG